MKRKTARRKTEKRTECKVESYKLWQSFDFQAKASVVAVDVTTFKRHTINIDNAYGELGALLRNAVTDGSSVYRYDAKDGTTTWGAK